MGVPMPKSEAVTRGVRSVRANAPIEAICKFRNVVRERTVTRGRKNGFVYFAGKLMVGLEMSIF